MYEGYHRLQEASLTARKAKRGVALRVILERRSASSAAIKPSRNKPGL
jgi:hypothetical protein